MKPETLDSVTSDDLAIIKMKSDLTALRQRLEETLSMNFTLVGYLNEANGLLKETLPAIFYAVQYGYKPGDLSEAITTFLNSTPSQSRLGGEMNCPFCGAVLQTFKDKDIPPTFECWTFTDAGRWHRSRDCYERQLSQQADQIANLQEVLEDKRRLTREIDIIINGANAAEQASLVDLIPQIRKLTQQADLLEKAMEMAQFIMNQNPWPPERGGYAYGCQFCGKPYPSTYSSTDKHHENCIWIKAQAIIKEWESHGRP